MQIKNEIYEIGKALGLDKKEIDDVLSAGSGKTSGIENSATDIYKAGTRYGTISSADVYKAGTSYGTISIKDF